MMMRARSARSALSRSAITSGAADGRHAEVVQARHVAAELVLELAGPARQRGRVRRPTGRRTTASARRLPTRRRARRRARTPRAPSARSCGSSRRRGRRATCRGSGTRGGARAWVRWNSPGQELAPGQVAGRAEQHDHVRPSRRDEVGRDVGRLRVRRGATPGRRHHVGAPPSPPSPPHPWIIACSLDRAIQNSSS